MSEISEAQLTADWPRVAGCFDRVPFGFSHNLSTLDLFSMGALASLARKYATRPTEYFVAGAASTAGTQFSAVPHGQYSALAALERLEEQPLRILLKRPENVDPAYGELLRTLARQALNLDTGAGPAKLERLESGIFITSSRSITPCHFDPEINFFSQVAGTKTYHVYAPQAVTEPQLESFYFRGSIEVCEVDLARLPAAHEHVFQLAPGLGLHQPQNAPHWVETGDSISISYTFVFETDVGRRRSRARAFNHLLRQAGLQPGTLGDAPVREAVKAGAMRVVIPLRRRTQRLAARFA
jgi:hypothetical protein